MRKLLLTVIALGTLAGCATGGYAARAPLPPPPPSAVYVRGPAPGAGYAWRDGYYDWNRNRYRGGYRRGYQWIGPGWVRPPRAGVSIWVDPGWRGKQWRRGYWR
jgi:hypothetical protein